MYIFVPKSERIRSDLHTSTIYTQKRPELTIVASFSTLNKATNRQQFQLHKHLFNNKKLCIYVGRDGALAFKGR
jgi:hypothetical protein